MHIPVKNITYDVDMEPDFRSICEKSCNFTMTSVERMYGLYKAIEYIVAAKIQGDVVECGTWKGGSSMVSALTLIEKKDKLQRNMYLYDTFEGMSEPTDKDVFVNDKSLKARNMWENKDFSDENFWCCSSIDEVKNNLYSTGYPKEKMRFIKGKVEDTIPMIIPRKIALLRLDTDFYESTFHEMKYLFPRLVKGGVLIVDDYGHWQGAKDAVDTFIREKKIKIFLNRLDYTGRIAIKY